MNRRNFLRFSGGALAGATAFNLLPLFPKQLTPRSSVPSTHPSEYKLNGDWTIRFSGWRPAQSTTLLAAQWFAFPSNPNGLAFYTQGNVLRDESLEVRADLEARCHEDLMVMLECQEKRLYMEGMGPGDCYLALGRIPRGLNSLTKRVGVYQSGVGRLKAHGNVMLGPSGTIG